MSREPFEGFGRKAPKGKFRVVGVDTFAREDWLVGDYDSEMKALDIAQEKGGKMLMMHVYNDRGKHVGKAGEF